MQKPIKRSAPKTAPKASKPAKATKPETKTEAKAPETKKPEASVSRAANYEQFVAKTNLYDGASKNFNSSRSSTPIVARDIKNYTYRLDCQLRELIKLYGNKPFARGQHGDVNRLLGNANIAKLNSDGTLQLTEAAIRAAGKLKALIPGDEISLSSFHAAGNAKA